MVLSLQDLFLAPVSINFHCNSLIISILYQGMSPALDVKKVYAVALEKTQFQEDTCTLFVTFNSQCKHELTFSPSCDSTHTIAQTGNTLNKKDIFNAVSRMMVVATDETIQELELYKVIQQEVTDPDLTSSITKICLTHFKETFSQYYSYHDYELNDKQLAEFIDIIRIEVGQEIDGEHDKETILTMVPGIATHLIELLIGFSQLIYNGDINCHHQQNR